ncbi:alcohol dehydrogenase catalytic domain-containing protein [Nocardioides convexus]|uniref:alcohol dehydrogenase catalytic domain-containing protein n=1 Tax=Nocardioides convexus TaxID=2712224 RepID=UPI0024181A8C|nr:alcohol dehydrogenase catalytic domain-containing protein [Nocardioides convexus]
MLVRIVATGLCHTDLTVPTMLPAEMMPTVVGHEGTGVVEQVGADVVGIEVGDHVVLSFRSCRACAPCRAGDVGYCEQSLLLNYMGMRADGSTTMKRGEQTIFGRLLRPVQPRPPRPGVRRQLRRRRQGARPDPARPLRLRLPDRGRHGPQRARPGRRRARRGLRRRRGRPRRGRRGPGCRCGDGRRRGPGRRASSGRRGVRRHRPRSRRRVRRPGRGPGQGAHRRRCGVRDRHHGDRRGGPAGPALPARTRPAGGARPGRAGVHHRRDRPPAVRQDRALLHRGRGRSAAHHPRA